jgi:DNA-binding NtrC family response regulator
MKTPHTTQETKTVLVLEDSQIIMDTIVEILEVMGFRHISSVSSLAEARLLVEKIVYDVYVSDCNLGEVEGEENGRDFLEEIALKAPDSARLFISGNTENFRGFKGETLPKPFDAGTLIRAVNRAMIASGQNPVNLS